MIKKKKLNTKQNTHTESKELMRSLIESTYNQNYCNTFYVIVDPINNLDLINMILSHTHTPLASER